VYAKNSAKHYYTYRKLDVSETH